MKKQTIKKVAFGALVLTMTFSVVTMPFAQTPTPRANGKIAYAGGGEDDVDIYVVNSDGSQQTRLTNSPNLGEYAPTWSPDGLKIAFLAFSQSDGEVLKLMNADGSNQTILTSIIQLPQARFDYTLTWAPDGRKIAFASAGDIYSINIDGSNLVNLTHSSVEDGHPTWSPDGSRIAFVTSYPPTYESRINVMNADGNNVSTYNSNYLFVLHPRWAPDGQRLVFLASNGDANDFYWSLVVFAPANGEITVNQCCSSWVDWSPDGNKFVLEYGTLQSPGGIYVMDANGEAPTPVVLGRVYTPNWQPLVSAPVPTVSVSGRVLTPDGRGLRSVEVSLTDSFGVRRTATTSSFGFYLFNDVRAGESYTVSVASRQYRFAPRTIELGNNLTDVDFIGLE